MTKSTPSLSIAFCYDDSLDRSDGVAQYVKNLGEWLSLRGHKVSYLVGESKTKTWAGGQVYSLSKNLPIRWAGNNLSISLIPHIFGIKQIIGQNQFDVVHVQVPYSPFMAQQVIARLNPKTALLGSIHAYPAGKFSMLGSKLLKYIYGRSLKRFDQWLAVSPVAVDYAMQAFGVEAVISPNVVWTKRFESKEQIKPGRIVFLGRLVARKGCKELLEAFKIVAEQNRDAELLIVSDGPMRGQLEKYVTDNKLGERVKFLGRVSESKKADILASAQIACFPSLYGESFGIVLIEAIAAGAGVVIGGDNPGYRSVLNDNEVLIEPKNQRSFAGKLINLLNDQGLLADIHNKQQRLLELYDIETVGPSLEQQYRQAIAKRRRTGHNLTSGTAQRDR